MARTVDDVLSRRTTGAPPQPRRIGRTRRPDVADLIGEVLGLSAEERTGQVEAYRASVEGRARERRVSPRPPLDAILGG